MSEQWQPGPGRRVSAVAEPGVWEQIEQGYGKPFAELTPPDGFEFVVEDGVPKAGLPKRGEWYLSALSGEAMLSSFDYIDISVPALLALRKLLEPKPRRWEERERCPGAVCVTFHAEGRSAWLYEVTE